MPRKLNKNLYSLAKSLFFEIESLINKNINYAILKTKENGTENDLESQETGTQETGTQETTTPAQEALPKESDTTSGSNASSQSRIWTPVEPQTQTSGSEFSKYGLGRNNVARLVDDNADLLLADYVHPGLEGPRSQANMGYGVTGGLGSGPYYYSGGDRMTDDEKAHRARLGNSTLEALRDFYNGLRESKDPLYFYRTAGRAAGLRPGEVQAWNGVFGGISPSTALRYDLMYRGDDGSPTASSNDPKVLYSRNRSAKGKITSPRFARGAEDRFEILETPLDPSRVYMPELQKKQNPFAGYSYIPMSWDSPEFAEAAQSGNYDAVINPFTGEIVILGDQSNPGNKRNELIQREGSVYTSGDKLGVTPTPKGPEHSVLTDIRGRALTGNDPMAQASQVFTAGSEPAQPYREWAPKRQLLSLAIIESNLKPTTKSLLIKILKRNNYVNFR